MKKWVFEHKGRDELNTWWENPTVESKRNSRFKLFIHIGRKFRGPVTWEFNSSSWGVRVGLSRISGHHGWNAVPGIGPGLYIIGLSRATKSRKNGRASSGEYYGPSMRVELCAVQCLSMGLETRGQVKRSELRGVLDWHREVEVVGKGRVPKGLLPARLVCLWVGQPDLNVPYPAGHMKVLRNQCRESRGTCVRHGLYEISIR